MKYFYSLLATILLLPQSALAKGKLGDAVGNLRQSGKRAGTSETDIAAVTGSFINTALSFVGIIFMALVVYAGYLWMTARGEEDQVGKARKILISALVGIVIVLGAYAITAIVTTRFAAL